MSDTTTPATPAPGTDAELDRILDGLYWCSRVREAWQYKTMGEDDFHPAAETDVRGDLLTWRDAAVAAGRKSLITDEAVQRAAEVMYRDYDSQYNADRLSWRDFADDARKLLTAALGETPGTEQS